MERMLCFPKAKINIGLNILERRPDHFHNIETIFYPVLLSDILEMIRFDRKSSKVDLKITGMAIPGDPETNLCVRAYHLLDQFFDLPPVTIYLHKLIPMGAGLGGGSSDGASALVLLNQLFELGLSDEQLVGYASKLGSDCTFFIRNKPAFGTEKGNILTDIPLDLSGKYMVLVKPNVFVSTAEAYQGVVPSKPEYSLPDLIKRPMVEWKHAIKNDFEESILHKYPEIKSVKEMLYKQGAVYSSMTGSGSAVYGIFEGEVQLKNCFPGMFYWRGECST
jgi:4-diphosphocytidyl-2-C-methyl-D-erythritol kinase